MKANMCKQYVIRGNKIYKGSIFPIFNSESKVFFLFMLICFILCKVLESIIFR